MRRREFITLFGGAAATQVIGPGLVRAGTSPKRPIIGIPTFLGPSKIGQSFGNLFRQGLQNLGYVLDRDLDIQVRSAGGDWDRLPAIAEEIVQLKPDVIYAFATVEAVAARKATSTIPIVCPALADAVRHGLSYGVDLRWCYHRSAYFVDKILRGAAPGDLPIEFPTQFPLSINLKTAKELGLTVPPALLARADEVIE